MQDDPASAPGRAARRPSLVPVLGEPAAPWLASAVVLGALGLLIVLRDRSFSPELIVALVGLTGTLTAAILVVRRSRREIEAALREERARPSVEELYAPAPPDMSYGEGMERWTSSTLELIEHALEVLGPDAPERAGLIDAAQDTRDLRDLLAAGRTGEPTVNDKARLHAIASLWESGQPGIEQLAGSADARWYRRWRARHVADRGLRHGARAVDQQVMDLPYRS